MAGFRPPNPELPADVQALIDDERRRNQQAEKAAKQAKDSSQHAWILGVWRGRGPTALERTTQTARAGARPTLLGGPPPKLPDRGR